MITTSFAAKSRSKNSRSFHLSESPDFSGTRFLYMNIRNKSYLVRPCTKLSQSRPATSHSIGPGKYNPEPLLKVESHEFSNLPRFDKDKLAHLLKAQSKAKGTMTRLESENLLKIYEKSKQKTRNSRAVKIKADIAKATKKNLDYMVKEEKILRLNEKFRKLEYRKRIHELAQIKKSWVVFDCIFGAAFSVNSFLLNRKKLRRRIYSLINKFRQIVIAVGKIVRKVKVFRRKKAMKRLKIFLLPKIKNWIIRRKKRYRLLITCSFDQVLTSTILSSASAKWLGNIKKIQNSFKLFTMIRKKLYSKLIQIWENNEMNYFSTSSVKSKKNDKKNLKKKVEKYLSVPDDVKKIFLLKLVKEKYKTYIEQMKTYFQSCRAIDELNRLRGFEINVMRNKRIPYPNRPKRILVLSVVTEADVTHLIKEADRMRPIWNELIAKSCLQVRRSYDLKKRKRK